MTDPHPRPSAGLFAVGLVAAAAAGLGAYWVYQQNEKIDALTRAVQARDADLEAILGEVNRLRIEQTTGQEGPQALLTRLKTYAPLLVSSRTAGPDWEMAKKEMDAVMRAFTRLGDTAWKPIVARMDELKADKNFDELKWLLEAAVRVDKPAGLELCRQVLLGTKFPTPRLRWYAATILIDLDKPMAQATLRQILTTESSRGMDPERAAAHNASIIDPAAFATTGFNNFVQRYVQSEDPKMDETLLMVIGRTEHDVMTLQDCIKVLGSRRCERAAEPIKKLYLRPPGAQENPIFLCLCLDAIAAIDGEKARPWFEEQLTKATSEKVANHLKNLLR